MAETYNRESENRSSRREVDQAATREHNLEASEEPRYGLYSPGLSSDKRLHLRGNAPVRASVMQRAQQTHGNRAVQRSIQHSSVAGAEGGPLGDELAQRIDSERGTGSPLPENARADMEQAFGEPLGDVRVHTGEEADTLSRDMSARAFATGSDIFFSQGTGPEDSRLLAHELTHVLQQRDSAESRPSLVGPEGSNHEQEADEAASEVAVGGQVDVSPSPSAAGSVGRDWTDLFKKGIPLGDWNLKPTWSGSTDNRYDNPENKRRAEMQDADKRSNDPSPPSWWAPKPYDPSAPAPWMPNITPQGPTPGVPGLSPSPILPNFPIPPAPSPDNGNDAPLPPLPEDEQYA